MSSFAENLGTLPAMDGVKALQLLDEQGEIAATIENKPGSQGSLRVYHFVANKWGELGPEAAQEALELYAEHTEEAQKNIGKHPNIDRLFLIIDQKLHYRIKLL